MRRFQPLLVSWCLLLTGIVCLSQSQAFYQSRDSNYNIAIASGGGSTTTFDTVNIGAGCVLSNGNLGDVAVGAVNGSAVLTGGSLGFDVNLSVGGYGNTATIYVNSATLALNCSG